MPHLSLSSKAGYSIVLIKKTQYLALVLLIMVLANACSRKKETWSSRTYHQMTANYNGYFYAKESFKEAKIILEENYKENWKEILPVFITGSDQDAKAIYPQLDRAIEKCSFVIERHSMVIKKKEENKWIKHNYFLIGKAYFYKKDYTQAAKIFDFVLKQYKDEPIRNDALWMLARTKMENDDLAKALSLLKVVEDEPGLEEELLSDVRATFADYYIRSEDYKKAIAYLEQAIIVTKNKDRRARLNFILAQLYQRTGKSAEAIDTYQAVVKLHPDYEMVFYASINQALTYRFRDGSSEEIKKMLLKMARDSKNVSYYDQIYFALADIELEEGNKEKAIEYYLTSAQLSIDNPEQKGMSFMQLGNLYMEDTYYKEANTYYDSTLTFLPAEHPKFDYIQELNEGLDELILNLDIFTLQDSLLRLASMNEKDREKILLNLIAAEEAAAEQALKETQQQNRNTTFRSTVDKSVPLSSQGTGGSGAWYFYNPNTMSSGYNEFKRKWGDRPLADDWRRALASTQNTLVDNGASEEEIIASIATQQNTAGKVSGVKTLDQYLAEIPLTDEAFTQSQKKVEDALYNSGVIYKEKLDDVDNAIEVFDELIQRFPDSEYLITSYYQLYRLYVKKEQSGNYFGGGFSDNSSYYKDLILEEFPYSEYAKLIRNPNYKKEAELTLQRKEEDYKATYRNYKSHRYTQVMSDCNKVINEDPDNPFMPKYFFLKAMVVGNMSDQANFERELQVLADRYPTTEEGEKAVEILNQLQKKGMKTGQDATASTNTETKSNASAMDFEDNKNVEHFFALIFPNELGSITRTKSSISNFNKKFYSQDRLKVTNSFINKDNQIVIVRRFSDGEKAMSYYNNFVNDQLQLRELNDQGLVTFLISSKNFSKLFKSKDIEGYHNFFKENYL